MVTRSTRRTPTGHRTAHVSAVHVTVAGIGSTTQPRMSVGQRVVGAVQLDHRTRLGGPDYKPRAVDNGRRADKARQGEAPSLLSQSMEKCLDGFEVTMSQPCPWVRRDR